MASKGSPKKNGVVYLPTETDLNDWLSNSWIPRRWEKKKESDGKRKRQCEEKRSKENGIANGIQEMGSITKEEIGSITKEEIGSITRGGFSFARGIGFGVAFCSLSGLLKLSKMIQNIETQRKNSPKIEITEKEDPDTQIQKSVTEKRVY